MAESSLPASASTLVVMGGSSPKVRKARRNDITEEQQDRFFAALAETCNVTRAARTAGFSTDWAYRRRKKDAAFRNAWVSAVREGYAKLELVLLERAIKGTPKILFRKDGSERVVREYSTALAVALLKRHADTADSESYEPAEAEMVEIRERILEKLSRIRDQAEEPCEE